MSVAARFFDFNAQSPTDWIARATRVLPPVVSAVLILAIAYQLAQITWFVLPGESYEAPPLVAAAPAGAQSAPTSDFATLRGWHPFGEAAAELAAAAPPPVQSVVDAPDTTLNLKLTGVIVKDINESSEAMIGSGNEAELRYFVGDTIEKANGATLHEVYHDRVILNRAGRLETLRLPDELTTTRPTRAAAAPLPGIASPTQNQSSLRQVISANASRLTDVLRLAPHVEGGQVVGFRVNPGRNEEAFTALGLQAGDVVTDINGLTLDDPSRGLQAFEALGESSMANVTVLRDGVPQVLVIDTSQLDAINEDRQ